MCISDTKKKKLHLQNGRTVLTYLAVSILTVAVDRLYALFGHGVVSAAMDNMYLYPLVGGALFYLLSGLIIARMEELPGYRIFYNSYNAGIAVLTVGSFLKGILEIAGTASSYVPVFYGVGWLFVFIGMIFLIRLIKNMGRTETEI